MFQSYDIPDEYVQQENISMNYPPKKRFDYLNYVEELQAKLGSENAFKDSNEGN